MSMNSSMLMLMALFASVPREEATSIRSYRIETKKENQQISKRKMQRLKGKKTRTNRGKNR